MNLYRCICCGAGMDRYTDLCPTCTALISPTIVLEGIDGEAVPAPRTAQTAPAVTA